ncbi:MAG: hypothetical protein IT258_17970 [Saprospiraceae bacterium]|nr:hypothetical protein [Saprospiraceae bacterium]
MKKLITLFVALILGGFVFAQISRKPQNEFKQNQGSILLMNFAYGGQLPGADMAVRFGPNFLAGVNVDYYTAKNWIFGVQGDFMFGKKVNVDVISTLRGSEGYVYADDGGLADIQLRERGLNFSVHFGKVFALSERNNRSGIRVTAGAGMLQHKIRIQDDPQVFVTGLSKSYKKGYDRLANGLALTEFIGYQFIANNRLVNFSIGVEFVQGFTKGRRSFNFDTKLPGLEKRLDLLYGYRLTWTLPLFIGENPDEISY